MKGLIRKDFYMIWEYGRMLLLMSAVFLGMSLFASDDNFFFVVYPVLFAGILPVTLISYEERDGWNRMCDAMPVSRRMQVNERYLMTAFCFLVLYLLTLGLQAAVLLPKGNAEKLKELACLLPGVGLLAPAVMIPVTLRWGVEKGRFVYYVFIGVIVALGLIGANALSDAPTEAAPPALWLLPLIAVVLFALSWLLSIRIYEKREL